MMNVSPGRDKSSFVAKSTLGYMNNMLVAYPILSVLSSISSTLWISG